MNIEGLKRKIRWQNKVIAIVGLALLAGFFIFINVFDNRTRSGIEFQEVNAYILADEKFKQQYGSIFSTDIDSYQIFKSMVDGSKNGCFQLKVKGELRTGLHRICWEKKYSLPIRILSQDTVETGDLEKVFHDIKSLLSAQFK